MGTNAVDDICDWPEAQKQLIKETLKSVLAVGERQMEIIARLEILESIMLPAKKQKTFVRSKSINWALSVLGVPYAYARPRKGKAAPGQRYRSVVDTIGTSEIVYDAEAYYRMAVKLSWKDDEAMKEINEAIAWIRRWAKQRGA